MIRPIKTKMIRWIEKYFVDIYGDPNKKVERKVEKKVERRGAKEKDRNLVKKFRRV